MSPGRVAGGLAAAVGSLLLGLGGTPTTSAGFTDAATVTGGGFGAASMTAPQTPAVRQVPGSGATRISWTAPAMGQHGGAPSSYDAYRYPGPSGDGGVLACTVDVGVSTDVGRALECDDTSRAPGTHHYAVVARQGSAWRAESPRREISPDLTGPSVIVTDPADGYRGSGFLLRLGLLFSCGAAPACGTAGDPAGVVDVRWSLEWRPSTGNRAPRCWTGSGFVAEPAGGCAGEQATTTPLAGGMRWRVPGVADAAYRDRGSYLLTVSAVDSFGTEGSARVVVAVT